MSYLLDAQVSEQIPTPGVYHSYNGKVYYGGREVMRISDALIRTSRNVATYPQVGTRYAIPYYRQLTVAGSLRKAFINLFEMAMAIGIPIDEPNHIPGNVYSGDGLYAPGSTPMATIKRIINDEEMQLGHYGALSDDGLPKNSYPIKTTMEFTINEEGLSTIAPNLEAQSDPLANPDVTPLGDPYVQSIIAYGIMIDIAQVSMGGGGDLITSGPIDWIGETWRFKSSVPI